MALRKLSERIFFIVLFCLGLGLTTTIIQQLEAQLAPRDFLRHLAFFKPQMIAPVPPQALFDGQVIKKTLLGLIGNSLQGDTISITTFLITDNDIAQALIKKHAEGVSITIVADGSNAHKKWSQIPQLIKAGIPVHLHTCDQDAENPGIMHNKFIIFENQDSAIAVTGSYNLTHSASGKNKENIVLINHPQTVNTFKQHFYNLKTASRCAQS